MISFSLSAGERVSLIELVSNSNIYQDKYIETEGILCVTLGGVALLISSEACSNKLLRLGLGLDLNKNIYDEREKHGHLKPVRVTGKFIITDNPLLYHKYNFKYEISKVKIKYLPLGSVKLKKIEETVENTDYIKVFAKAIETKDIKVISNVLELNAHEVGNKRLKWILFKSPNSLSKTLKDKTYIDFYSSVETDDTFKSYFACLSNHNTYYENSSEMPESLESDTSVCFEYFYQDGSIYRISSAYFGVY